tara:strand:- start:158 stop:373 length:216 start_codon:yes stop_codon:yes gene_type:complete
MSRIALINKLCKKNSKLNKIEIKNQTIRINKKQIVTYDDDNYDYLSRGLGRSCDHKNLHKYKKFDNKNSEW